MRICTGRAAEIPAILERIHLTPDLSEACRGATVVIETITKIKMSRNSSPELDRLCRGNGPVQQLLR